MALTRPRAAQIYDIDYKQATRVVTVSNITVSGGAPNQVDGVNLSLNDRVLVTGQSTASQNGIYYVTIVGSGSNGTWSRSLDTDTTGEILTGTIVMVTEGTVYHDTQWKLITDGIITVGVTDQDWVQNYSANSISSGTSNVVVTSNANVTVSSNGTANVLTISNTGAYIGGLISATGNVTGNYILGNGSGLTGITVAAGSSIVNGTSNVLVAANGNVTIAVAGTTIGTFASTGQLVTGVISASGNVTGNYILGNGALLTGVSTTSSNINNGTSNVTVVSSGGNITTSIGGTSNVIVVSSAGQFVNGIVSASGAIIGSMLQTNNAISANTTFVAGINSLLISPITIGIGVVVTVNSGAVVNIIP